MERIFISSVQKELAAERRALAAARKRTAPSLVKRKSFVAMIILCSMARTVAGNRREEGAQGRLKRIRQAPFLIFTITQFIIDGNSFS